MKIKEIISYTFSGLMLACMLFIVAIFIRWEFFTPAIQQNNQQRIQQVNNWQQLDINGWQAGAGNAPVRIVEFFDYQCPYCKQVEPALQAVKEKYGNKINLVYQHFPLSSHSFAFEAAVAAECARRQNKFKEYHDLLFAHQKQIGRMSSDSLAVVAGIANLTAFKKCVESEATAKIVRSGKSLGTKIGVNSTPTFLINGTLVTGALSERQLIRFVEKALAESQ